MNFCIEYSQCAPGLKESTKHYNLGNLRKELKVGKVEMKILILIHASNQNPTITDDIHVTHVQGIRFIQGSVLNSLRWCLA